MEPLGGLFYFFSFFYVVRPTVHKPLEEHILILLNVNASRSVLQTTEI